MLLCYVNWNSHAEPPLGGGPIDPIPTYPNPNED